MAHLLVVELVEPGGQARPFSVQSSSNVAAGHPLPAAAVLALTSTEVALAQCDVYLLAL